MISRNDPINENETKVRIFSYVLPLVLPFHIRKRPLSGGELFALHVNHKSKNYWKLKEKRRTAQITALSSFLDGINYIKNWILSFSIHATYVSN